MQAILLDSHSPGWSRSVDELRAKLGAPNNSALFPPHFLKGAFPSIGGHLIEFRRAGNFVGAGFLFPRSLDASPVYTLRYQQADGQAGQEAQAEIAEIASGLFGASIAFYDPLSPQQYARTDEQVGAISLGAPGEHEAAAIRELQRAVWGAGADNLYPADIHSVGFSLATSLVVRVDNRVAGFCFGFYKFGGPPLPPGLQAECRGDLRIESQVLAVSSSYRGRGIAAMLKRAQAAEARARGIEIINWTVDPLQYANARLNYNELGAAAFDFFPNYLLDFQNDLNQAPASRFGVTWVVSSGGPCYMEGSTYTGDTADLPRVSPLSGEDAPLAAFHPAVAIEIPRDWNALQAQDIVEARRWRTATDALFARYIGSGVGKYAITGAFADAERRYLVGRL